MPQVFSLHRELSVLENLRVHRRGCTASTRPSSSARAAPLLERTGLAPFARPPGRRALGRHEAEARDRERAAARAARSSCSTSRPPASTSSRAPRSASSSPSGARDALVIALARATSTRPRRATGSSTSTTAASSRPARRRSCARAAPLELYRVWGDDAARDRPRGARAAVRRERARRRARSRASRCRASGAPPRADVLRTLARAAGRASLVEHAARRHGVDRCSRSRARGARGMSAADHRARDGLTKRFGDFTAVDALDLAVEPGTIFAFLGANGSGKSTTIRMLIGLLTPTAGTIEVDGVDVIREPRRVRDRIGYMGQKVSLYQGLTLRENVEFYAGLYGLDGARARGALGRAARALRARRGGARAARGPAGRRAPARRARARDAAPAARSSSSTSRPPASTSTAAALFWERIQEEADARRHGVRHDALPRGGRVLRLGLVHRRRPARRRRDAGGAARALLGRLPRRRRASARPRADEPLAALERGGLRGRRARRRTRRAAPRDARRTRALGALARRSRAAAAEIARRAPRA